MKTIEFYRDTPSTWRWRLVAGNGRLVATSGENYARLGGAQKGARGGTWYHVRPDVKMKISRRWAEKRFSNDLV